MQVTISLLKSRVSVPRVVQRFFFKSLSRRLDVDVLPYLTHIKVKPLNFARKKSQVRWIAGTRTRWTTRPRTTHFGFLKRTAVSYKSFTGVRIVRSQSKSSLNLSDDYSGKATVLSCKVELIGKIRPVQVSLFFDVQKSRSR